MNTNNRTKIKLNYRQTTSCIINDTNTTTKLQVLQMLLLELQLHMLNLASSALIAYTNCLDLDNLALLLTKKKKNMALIKGWSHKILSPTLSLCIDHMGIGFKVLFYLI